MNLYRILGFGTQGWGTVLLLATLLTVSLTLTALAVGAVIGAMVAAAKLSSRRSVRIVGEAYTTIFRGAPELLIIYLFYFGSSNAVTAVARLFGAEGFISVPAFAVGAIAVGVISGAYQAEVYRAAVLAVPPGEIEAARAIGMSLSMVWRRVLIPQVVCYALPGIGKVWQLSLKDSALISVTGLAELMRTSQIAAGSTHQYFTFYVAGGALYILLTSVSNRIFNHAETRVGRSFRQTFARQ